jgi:hypothetical protein
MLSRFSVISVSLVVFLFSGCNLNPVSDTWPDQIEFESVYQWIKVYSIYQDSSKPEDFPDRVDHFSQDPFSFKSPSQMLESIHDTLKGYNYTRYTENPNLYQASSSSGYQLDTSFVRIEKLTDSTVYLAIYGFERGYTYNQFLSVIGKADSFPNIIVDLRGNLGGDLDELDSIAEAFLPRGSKFIKIREREYDSQSKSGYTKDWHPWVTTKYPDPALDKKKISVLMDNSTASAAEILASALKDCDSAKLIGDRSYGKGMGQRIIVRRNRPAFEITALQIQGMTPRTGFYHEKGIEPDTIPSDLQTEGRKYFPDIDNRNLFYAVKMLEPGASATSIKMSLPKSRILMKAAAGYKVTYDTLNQ